MTWWDHSTGTVWSQPLGEAIIGPLKGETLELMASQVTSWATWIEDHPETVALDVSAGPSRFRLIDMSIVVEFGEQVGVYAVADLMGEGPANDTIAGVPVSVVVDQEDRWNVVHRRVGETVLTLDIVDGALVDAETSTRWDPSNGRGLSGPLEGEVLGILPGFTSFESDARVFWPDAKYWGRRDQPVCRCRKMTCSEISMSENDKMDEHKGPIPSWLL